jgi:anti-sigma B factor antagonist
MKLHLGTRIVCGITVVECNGRIILGDESAALRQMVRDLLKDHHQLVLDLGNVTYIDSSGLGVLVGLWSSAKKSGGEIKLANLSPAMNDMLQLTKLVTVFQIFDRVEDAAATFNPGAGRSTPVEWEG